MYDEADLNMTTLEIDAPGMPKDYVNVSVFEGNLTISFEAPFGVDTGSPRFYRQRERQYGHLTRVMKLPAGTKVRRLADPLRVALVRTLTLFWTLQPGDLSTNMDRGVLTIKFPTTSEHQPEKIAITSTE